jgi:hypothetical protein
MSFLNLNMYVTTVVILTLQSVQIIGLAVKLIVQDRSSAQQMVAFKSPALYQTTGKD